jgi:hypothetical protein
MTEFSFSFCVFVCEAGRQPTVTNGGSFIEKAPDRLTKRLTPQERLLSEDP